MGISISFYTGQRSLKRAVHTSTYRIVKHPFSPRSCCYFSSLWPFRSCPLILLHGLYVLLFYLHRGCLSLGITLHLFILKLIDCHDIWNIFCRSRVLTITMNQIVCETFMRKFSISFVENIVVSISVIHRQHLQNFLLDNTYLLYCSLLNIFKVRCPLIGGIADMVHTPRSNPGRAPCLGIYSFRSVSHINKIVVGPPLPILW